MDLAFLVVELLHVVVVVERVVVLLSSENGFGGVAYRERERLNDLKFVQL